MAIIGDDFEISCEQDKKTGQLLCKGKKGQETGIVLGQVGKDGTFKLTREKGSLKVIERLKEYMNDKVSVNITTNKDDDFKVGEF